jgi:hypothetical protein
VRWQGARSAWRHSGRLSQWASKPGRARGWSRRKAPAPQRRRTVSLGRGLRPASTELAARGPVPASAMSPWGTTAPRASILLRAFRAARRPLTRQTNAMLRSRRQLPASFCSCRSSLRRIWCGILRRQSAVGSATLQAARTVSTKRVTAAGTAWRAGVTGAGQEMRPQEHGRPLPHSRRRHNRLRARRRAGQRAQRHLPIFQTLCGITSCRCLTGATLRYRRCRSYHSLRAFRAILCQRSSQKWTGTLCRLTFHRPPTASFCRALSLAPQRTRSSTPSQAH